jgi:hypothetical protein
MEGFEEACVGIAESLGILQAADKEAADSEHKDHRIEMAYGCQQPSSV